MAINIFQPTPLLKALFIKHRLPSRYKKKLELLWIIPNFYLQYFYFLIKDLLDNEQKPGISVVIPCYNQGEYLIEAIESVINQTYQNIEIIIINDSSNDDTLNIANKIKNKYQNFNIKLISNPQNVGLSESRNIGIRNSTFNFIYLMDGDDKIEPSTLEILYKFIKYKHASFVCPGMKKFGAINKSLWKSKININNQPFINNFHVVGLFKKEAWKDAGGFNPNMVYGWEDWDFSLSLLENKARIVDAAKPLYYHRRKEKSMMSSLWNDERKKRRMLIQLIKNHPRVYSKYIKDELVSKFSYRNIDKIKFRRELDLPLNNPTFKHRS